MSLRKFSVLLILSLLTTIALLVAAFFSGLYIHKNLWRFLSWPAQTARLWNDDVVLRSITGFIFTKLSQGNIHITEALILIFSWWPVAFGALYFAFRTKSVRS